MLLLFKLSNPLEMMSLYLGKYPFYYWIPKSILGSFIFPIIGL